ncbi:MAG TPA: ABC transporter ATP-binding protein [Verrucomicrobiae bacterium]|nr:ABC transporter ATP-binding protein [Verrucomicrobiae bacterium]
MSDAPIVEARGVTKTYVRAAEKIEAIRRLDMIVGRGEMVAVTGESGSGKTTLLNLLGCIDRPTAGSLKIAGTAVESLGERALTGLRRRVVGFVFQEFSLIPSLTVEANVRLPLMFGREESAPIGAKRAAELLERVGLSHRARFHPRELSGGEAQRAAIARALVRGPSLLLADEPTGNLDPRNAASIFDLFAELNARDQLTILVVTHSEELAARAGRRLHLADGRLTG